MEITSPFLNSLIERSKKKKVTMVFPEAYNARVLAAASALASLDAIVPVLLGDPSKTASIASENNLDLSKCVILDNTEELREKTKQEFLKVSDEFSEKALGRRFADAQYLAAALVRTKQYDCLTSGFGSATEEAVMACKMMLGMQEGISVVSSFCILEAPDFKGSEGSLLCFTDCVVVPNPNNRELAEIAILACDTARKLLGWEPRAALLSFSTKGSAENENTRKVIEAVEIANQLRPDLLIEGEYQLDTAIDPAVAEKKVKVDNKVAGRANILVFPDLNAGNIGVKLVNYFANLPVHGALLQGLTVPTVECSRSASVEQIMGALLMLAVSVGEDKE